MQFSFFPSIGDRRLSENMASTQTVLKLSGEEEADAKDMTALQENPEGHWSFKARIPKE